MCATGYVGYILSDRLHTMHKAACGIHADMRLVSDTPGSPFLDWCALRLWRLFALVVVSGTCFCMRSTCTEALIGVAIQDSILRFSRLKSPNMTCNRYILKHRLCTAHMPDKSLSVVAGIYQCNPAIPHNDCIHPLQECLPPGLFSSDLRI